MDKYEKIKENNKNSIVIIKYGLFYNVFHEDAIIISYLMNYKLFYNNNKLCTSFTDKSISLVLSRLRLRKISYIVVNKMIKEEYLGSIIEYNKILNESNKVNEKMLLIEKIVDILKNTDDKKVKKIYLELERN